jgi:hypothetical protein
MPKFCRSIQFFCRSRAIFVAQRGLMAKQLTIEKELTDLRAFLAGYPEGISVSKLGSHYNKLLNERTLQRRLATLLQQGIIRTTGRGSSLIYYLVKSDENPAEPVQPTHTAVPLSAEGQITKRLVQQPVRSRIPVIYQPGFLVNYVPNVSRWASPTAFAFATGTISGRWWVTERSSSKWSKRSCSACTMAILPGIGSGHRNLQHGRRSGKGNKEGTLSSHKRLICLSF